MSSKKSFYPQVDESNPDSNSPFNPHPTSSNTKPSSLYPTIQMNDLAGDLFPDTANSKSPSLESVPFESSEEILIKIPNAVLHLIDQQRSIELATGDFTILRLKQNDNVVAVLARIGEEIQFPLAKDEAAVKLDDSHYFFTLRVPPDHNSGTGAGVQTDDLLNYGLTIASSKGKDLDGVLELYSAFSVQEVGGEGEVVAKGMPAAAYWTTLAPNVEEYSGSVARMIAAGSGQVIRGILWCGDVTVDGLRWGNEVLKKRVGSASCSDVSPQAMRRMKRVKKLTKMSENVATGILSGVVKVSGFFTSSIANSGVGKKFFSLLPGEIVLASLDGFNKVFDAVEVAGRNVMSTTSVVTTGLVSQRYGEQAGEVTHEGLGAAGHAIGTAWAVFKIRKALNPKSVIKPTTLVKAAAAEAFKHSVNVDIDNIYPDFKVKYTYFSVASIWPVERSKPTTKSKDSPHQAMIL